MELKSKIAHAKITFMNKRNQLYYKNTSNKNVSTRKRLVKVYVYTIWLRILVLNKAKKKIPRKL
jgi:hypothetical protein